MSSEEKKKKNFVHENPFSCAVCRKAFARKVGLRSHIKKTKHSISKKWPAFLQTVLPDEWSYTVSSFSRNGTHYKTKIVIPTIVTINELRLWIDKYMNLSQCVYIRVGRKKNRSSLTPYSEFYRCQHFHPRKNGKKRSKGTGCKSSITASIKCDFSANPYYSVVCINFSHNHSTHSGETLKFRKPSLEVENIFQRMLEDGCSPASALKNFIIHLEFQPADLYVNSIGNRTKCPDYNWVHHFSGKLFKKMKIDSNGERNIENVEKQVVNINEEFNGQLLRFQALQNQNFIVSILTPLMKRGLESLAAGEIIHVDCIDCIGKFCLNFMLLSCPYNATTRIPLGVIILTEESPTTVEQGFRLYLSMINDASFGGRGRDGPTVIMSDNSKIKIKALKVVFPKASILWSSFHFLKSSYCWLLNSKYHVNKDDLGQIYSSIRKLVYAADENMFESRLLEFRQHYSFNPHLNNYLKNLLDKRHKWAICFRNLVLRQNTECKKILLYEMQILREEIVNRVKMQSLDALFRYFITDYDSYYVKKLIDNCVDLNQNYFNKFYNDTDSKNYTFGPYLESDNLYYVYNKSKKTKYLVNVDVGMCTCYIGVRGNFCRHQRVLIDSLNEEPLLQYPIIVEPKIELYYIATGTREISQTFFDSFQSIIPTETDAQYAMEVVLNDDGNSDSSCIDDIEENLDTHIVEEILIEVQDENSIDQYEDTDCVATTSISKVRVIDESTNSPSNSTNDLRESFHSFVTKMSDNMEFYEPGMQAMYEELKKLNNGSASDRLLALKSFNKCA